MAKSITKTVSALKNNYKVSLEDMQDKSNRLYIWYETVDNNIIIKFGEVIGQSIFNRLRKEKGGAINNTLKLWNNEDYEIILHDKPIHERLKKELSNKKEYFTLRWDGEVGEGIEPSTNEAYIVESTKDVTTFIKLVDKFIEELTIENSNDPDCFRNDASYTLDFGLRDYQKNLVEQMFNILTERKEVLGYISTRAGKSFMALKTLLDMCKKRILIITAYPSAKGSFKEIVKRHKSFMGYHWVDWVGKSDVSTLKDKDNIVVFCSFQLADLKKECIQALLETSNFDACIIDEIHNTSDTDRSEKFVNALDIPYKLYLSGTPFNDLYKKRFDPECIVEYDFLRFIEECKCKRAVEEGREDYPRLPQMHIRLIDSKKLDAYIKKELSEDYDCSIATITECFNENVVSSFLKYLLCGAKKVQKSLAAPNKVSNSPNNKIIMYLPSRKVVDFFYDCANKYLSDKFTFMNLNNTNESASKLEESINKFFTESEKAVVFTCAKATTGVTIPELDTIYLLNSVSTENFVQIAFRTMNECYGKSDVYINILQDEIIFKVISEYASVTNRTGHNKDERDIVQRFYNCIDFQQLTGDYATPNWVAYSLEDMVGGVRKYNRITSNEKLKRNIMKNYSLDNLPADVDFTEVYEKLFKGKKSSSEKLSSASTGVTQSDANKEESNKGAKDKEKESSKTKTSEEVDIDYAKMFYSNFVETFFGYLNYVIHHFDAITTSERTLGEESICNYEYFDYVMSKVKATVKKNVRKNLEEDALVDFCYSIYTSIIENNKGLFQEQINAIRNAQKSVLEATTIEDCLRLRAELEEFLPRVATEDSAGIPFILLQKMFTM